MALKGERDRKPRFLKGGSPGALCPEGLVPLQVLPWWEDPPQSGVTRKREMRTLAGGVGRRSSHPGCHPGPVRAQRGAPEEGRQVAGGRGRSGRHSHWPGGAECGADGWRKALFPKALCRAGRGGRRAAGAPRDPTHGGNMRPCARGHAEPRDKLSLRCDSAEDGGARHHAGASAPSPAAAPLRSRARSSSGRDNRVSDFKSRRTNRACGKPEGAGPSTRGRGGST